MKPKVLKPKPVVMRSHAVNIRSAIVMMQRVKKSEIESGKKRLNMGGWCNNNTEKELGDLEMKDVLHNCGSTACFAGFCGMWKPFLKQGVRKNNVLGYPFMAHIGSKSSNGFSPVGDVMLALFGFGENFARKISACAGGQDADIRNIPTPATCDDVIYLLKGELKKIT